jgi:ABC-type ATPase with predicted acetyltransferase domain
VYAFNRTPWIRILYLYICFRQDVFENNIQTGPSLTIILTTFDFGLFTTEWHKNCKKKKKFSNTYLKIIFMKPDQTTILKSFEFGITHSLSGTTIINLLNFYVKRGFVVYIIILDEEKKNVLKRKVKMNFL